MRHASTISSPAGPGVERIAEEVVAHFPDARTIVLSSDILGGVRRLRLELEAIAKGEADIVIGTQLVAKGHNFPNMTLVGVVDADLGLANGDPRAAERTFQLLSQVTGRAGRTGKKSLGLLQTFQPDHPVMRAIVSGDAEAFYEREIAERETAGLPPFGRLAGIIVSAATRAEAEGHARGLRRAAPPASDIPCSARPRRRWRCSPAATASACWCMASAAPTCRPLSAPCLPPARSCAARSGCRSTSTRRASCEELAGCRGEPFLQPLSRRDRSVSSAKARDRTDVRR